MRVGERRSVVFVVGIGGECRVEGKRRKEEKEGRKEGFYELNKDKERRGEGRGGEGRGRRGRKGKGGGGEGEGKGREGRDWGWMGEVSC